MLQRSSQPSSSMASRQTSFRRSLRAYCELHARDDGRLRHTPGQLTWLATSWTAWCSVDFRLLPGFYVLAELKALATDLCLMQMSTCIHHIHCCPDVRFTVFVCNPCLLRGASELIKRSLILPVVAHVLMTGLQRPDRRVLAARGRSHVR
jgi:hypothetical protein